MLLLNVCCCEILDSSVKYKGVTFLAYGNGAPDIFSALAALSDSKTGGGQLGIQALFGRNFISSFVLDKKNYEKKLVALIFIDVY